MLAVLGLMLTCPPAICWLLSALVVDKFPNIESVALAEIPVIGIWNNCEAVEVDSLMLEYLNVAGVNVAGVNVAGVNVAGVNTAGVNFAGVNTAGVITGVTLEGIEYIGVIAGVILVGVTATLVGV